MALHVRKNIVDLTTACQIQHKAEALMAGGEYEIDSLSVLSAAQQSGCSAYDCEFVALAQGLSKPLITADKKLLRAFPDVSVTVNTFITAT